MFIFPQKELDTYAAIVEASTKPLPAHFAKHCDLLDRVRSTDRFFEYSDCRDTVRRGREEMRRLISEINSLMSSAETQDEAIFLQYLINNYTSINFDSGLPEMYHPDYPGRKPFSGSKEFIETVGYEGLASGKLLASLNNTADALIEMSESLQSSFPILINQARTPLIYCDPSINQFKLYRTEAYKEGLYAKPFLISDKHHKSISKFLVEHEANLQLMVKWCSTFYGVQGYSSGRTPKISMFNNCKTEGCDVFEMHITDRVFTFAWLLDVASNKELHKLTKR